MSRNTNTVPQRVNLDGVVLSSGLLNRIVAYLEQQPYKDVEEMLLVIKHREGGILSLSTFREELREELRAELKEEVRMEILAEQESKKTKPVEEGQ